MIRDLSPTEWRGELDSFSRQHQGWLVSVITRNPDGQTSFEAHDLPLQGVSQIDPHSKDIAVEVGDMDRHVTHEVRNVIAMSIDVTDSQAERALIIDSGDRARTTVTFRSPMRAEEVDGLPHSQQR